MLSLNKRNYATKKTIDKLEKLIKRGIIYFSLGNYYYDKLHKRKIDKINYNELKKFKKHCSYKKIKHYDSMMKNNNKKVKKIENTIKVKCKSCGCDMKYRFIVTDCDNCCKERAEVLGIV